ncbi:MAG: glycoside hydrolase family 9 protein [Xenococcaceae cyanobacterium MO_188.B19]|nr:glycoside hydrolase family 9 protein [Xenococcaceae cyanobacterium MO_188.B19]
MISTSSNSAPGETVHFAFNAEGSISEIPSIFELNGETISTSTPAPTLTPEPMPSYNQGGDGHNHNGDSHNHDGDGHTHGEPLPDTDSVASDGTVFKVDGTTQRITNFNLATDKVDLGPDSIHNQIAIDTPEGIVFQNYHHLERSLTLVGVSLKELKADNFTPIADAHLQQDLSAALAWENGEGFVRPNTVYVRSHEQNLPEEVEFDPAKDKISFFYLSVRGDSQQNFTVEETSKGVRFYSPVTGQSITLKGIKFSDLNSSHFEWRANQLEDNIAGRMGLSDKIADFRIVQSNVFNGKSVAMAGGVDRAPYHSQPEYTGTRIGSNPDPMPTPDPDPMPTPDPAPMPTPDPDPMPTGNSEVNFAITNDWGSGYQGQVEITNKNTSDLNNWTLKFELAGQINQIWGAEIVSQTGNTYVLRNAPYNGTVASGDKVAFGFIGEGSTSNLPDVFELNGKVVGDMPTTPTDPTTPTEPTDPTTPTEPTMPGGHNHNGDHPGAFNYAEAIQKSFLFYEANRSGELPADNRIPWRGDSALNDGADVGRDLTGGYYDAGDHVKFGFPMAASMTMLAWGGEQYSDAYDKIGQKDELLDAVKWGTDYILKAYDDKGTADVSDDVFYGQVGNGQADHSFWGPPEIMTMNRPTYQIDAQNPGSDLAGESAAALASASIIFRPSNQAYADQLLTQAQKLYEFAETYQGKYSDSITDARNFYNSWSGYTDELAWGATWLHKATEAAGQTDTQYLAKAEQYYQDTNGIQYAPFTQNWDDKKYGTAVLLAQETGDTQYQVQVEAWLDRWMIDRSQGGIPKYTEGGLAWLDQWGANRYSANTAMLAGIYSDTVNDKGGIYNDFVHSQVKYMLGDNPLNMSYMIGFGDNYPQNPHHRGAHGSLNNNINGGETKHILYGALVGGPSQPYDSAYNDRRDDYISNEVTTDYNAGFTGALAYLANRHSDMPLPDSEISNLFGYDTTPPGSALAANSITSEFNDQNMDMFAQQNTFELTPPTNY